MNKPLILFLSIVTALSAHAQTSQPEHGPGPMITFEQQVHDYGEIRGEVMDGNWAFSYQNTGDQPLILSNCQTSCGCLVATCDHEPLAPGKSATVKVRYDTMRLGSFQKTITVTSNAVNTPVVYLRIMGKVLPDPETFRLLPDSLLMVPANRVPH